MAHREDFEPIQTALAAALGGLASRGAAGTLQPIWVEVVGRPLAGASRPARFNDGVLEVSVDGPAWLRTLQAQSDELERRLRVHLPGFTRIELRLRGGAPW